MAVKQQDIPTWGETSATDVPSFDDTVPVKKKETGEEPLGSLEESITSGKSKLVSTPDQEFLTQEAEARRESHIPLFDKEDKKSKEGEASFAENVSEVARQAEQPISFINEANYANKRLEAIRRNVPEFIEEARVLHDQLQTATPDNIAEINTAIDRLEGWIKPVESRTGQLADPRAYRTWSNYRDEAKSDSYFAVKNLQDDNEKLRKAASFSKGVEEAERTASEQFSDEDLERFVEFEKNPRRLQGATEDERDKYTSFKEMAASGKTIEDVEDARKALTTGIGVGVKEYVEGYTKLTDELRGNRAVVELTDKLAKAEQGEQVELTTNDKLLMRALVENAKLHNELDSEIPQSYKVGESLGTSIGFMADFLISGGAAKTVGKSVVKEVAKRSLKEVGEVAAKAGVAKKLGVGTAVKLAQTGTQVPFMPTFYKKAAENVSNGMGVGEAFLYSFWETGAEAGSERTFMTNPVGTVAGKGAASFLRKAGVNFNVDKGGVGVLKNILEEAAEEKIGEIMTAPKDYDSFKEFWQGFTDAEQNKIMLGSVALMTGGMGSVALSGNTLSETRRKALVKRIEKNVPSDLRAEIDIILENKDLTLDQQYGLINDAISDRIDSKELNDDPATTTGNAIKYAQYKMQEKASQATDENAVVENGELTVGEVEEVGNMQDQVDYLQERGVDVNGLNGEQVEKLYEKTKAEEDKAAMEEATPPTEEEVAKETEKPTETEEKPSQKEEKIATDEELINEKMALEFADRPTEQESKRLKEVNAEIKDRGITNEQIQDIIDKQTQPRAEQLKEEKRDDEKKMQEQQVQKQDEERQTEKPTEEEQVSEEGDETRQEDVVQEEVKVKSFKKGDGGTKGTFKDDSGTVYKSLVPTEARIVDGKAERVSMEGKTTDEYDILSELQDRDYVPKIGKKVSTSEGEAFEIEELQEAESISIDEYKELRRQLQELEDEGYFIGDNVSVMRRNGKLVITDFSNAYKGSRGGSNMDYVSSAHDLLKPMDKAVIESTLSAMNVREVSDLVGEDVEPNTYLLTQRPPSIGTHPTEGLVGEPKETKMGNRTVWELQYDKPLSDADIKRYELNPVLSMKEYGGMMVDGVSGNIPFYIRNIDGRTVTLAAVNPKGKTIENTMRTSELVAGINSGKYKLTNPSLEAPQPAAEAQTQQKGITTPTEEKVAEKRSKQDFDEFVKDVISDETNLTGVRVSGLNKQQVKQAVKNTKEGKETVASKRLMDALDLMYKEGMVEFDASIERGGASKTVSLADFRKSLQRSAEREREIEREATELATAKQAEDIERIARKRRESIRNTKKEENKERLARIFDNAAKLTGVRVDITGEERNKVRQQLIDDVIEYVKTEFELVGDALSERVKSFVRDNEIQIDDLRDEEITKSKSYAKEQPSSKVQKKSTEKREERKERDKDLPKGDRSKLQDGKKAKEKVNGYKSSRFGVRYAFGEGFTEGAKEAYRQGELYKYKPESQQEIVDVAEVLFNTNDNEGVETIFKNKDVPKRVRVALGTLMMRNYSNEAEKALREGSTERGDKMIDLEQATIQEMQRIGTELGKDLAFYGSELVMDNFTPYKTARIVERKMNDQADKVRKSKDYKRAKTVVQDELQKLRPSVMKAVGKQKKVQDAKKKAKRKSETDPRKTKIRKEISDLTDMLRATRGSSASMSVIGLSNEQIEIGGKIAAKYVELGIINVKELVSKLKKEFGKAGIEITEDEAKRMIPEKDGKTVDELEKEQALEAAAEKLAQEEFGYVADRRAPKYDPIAQMVRTLTSKFRERAKEGERPAPRSNMDVIKEAILNKTDYMEVWAEARQSAMDLIDEMVADEKVTEQQAEKYREQVEKSYQNATTFSVSEKRVQQLIRESMKERDVSIDDVVRDHYERRELHKQELIDDLVNKSGLTNEAAKELAGVIDNAFQTLMAQKGEALIKKYLKKKEVKPKKAGAKSPVAELIELVNIGALNSPEFDTIFEEMYGVPKLTDEQRNEIVRRGKKIQKIKAADVRHKEEQKLMSYVMDLEGVNAAEILTAFWYAHVLSGVATHIRNIADAYVSSYLEPLQLAGFDVRVMREMIKAHRRGMKYEGRQRFLETMTTGFTPLAKKLEIPSALERIKFEPKDERSSSKVLANVANMYRRLFRVVPRALSGTDSYIYSGAKESAAYVVKYRRERQRLEDEKGRKLNRAEKKTLRKHINDLLYVDEASMNRFKAVVEQESEDYKQIQKDFGEEPTGYNEREKKLRVFELIDQERGLEVTDTAFDIAGRALGNIRTYGTIGQIVDGTARFLRRFLKFTIGKPNFTVRNGKPRLTFDQTKSITISPLGLVIAFTRVVANTATRNLGWNMYIGAFRAATGKFGRTGKDSRYHMEMSPEEKKVAWQKLIKVGIIHSMLFMLTQPDDDGDSFINITFNGTGEYEKNKQLEQLGWKPYSIQIGSFSMSYLPLAGISMIFAPIGYIRDKQKYTDTDLSVLELYAKGNAVAIGHVLKSTPIYAVNKLFDAINSLMNGQEDRFFKKLSQTAGSMATGFVSPKAVSDIINFMGVVAGDPREKPETAIARALQYVPIVDLDEGRIHYNVFGEPIPKNMSVSQIVDVAKQDEDIQYYIEQGYFRPALEMGRTEFRLEDERGEPVARTLNPRYKQEVDMFNKYEQEVGQAFKEAVTDLKEDGVEGEEFVEEMTKRWLAIVKAAKDNVRDYSFDYPVKYDKDAEIRD